MLVQSCYCFCYCELEDGISNGVYYIYIGTAALGDVKCIEFCRKYGILPDEDLTKLQGTVHPKEKLSNCK